LRLGRLRSRWCTRHDAKVREGYYFSAGEWRAHEETWSEPLKLLATNAWWLSEVTLTDFAAFDKAYSAEVEGRTTLDKVSLLRLLVAAYMKELEAIDQWLLATDDARGISAGATPWGASQWSRAVVIAAAFGGKSSLPGTEVKRSGLKEFFCRGTRSRRCKHHATSQAVSGQGNPSPG